MQGSINEFLKPRVVKVQPVSLRHARIVIEPFERGFGHTLGNALRRVLLSSLPGAAITEIEIDGVLHEYTAIEGVQEDVVDILLNLKAVAIRMHTRDVAEVRLHKKGPGPVLAGDIAGDHDLEILNPELVIANLTKAGELSMSLKVERGRGYRPAAQRMAFEEQTRAIGRLQLDASFSPVHKVTYNIVAYNEHAAVLHYQHLDRRPPPSRRSFLIDAGAQFRGYASDITRTYAAAAGLFADLLQRIDGAQQQLCRDVVAGRDFREIHLTAHRILGDELQRIGLTKLPGQAALERGVTSVFFPHGIGHLLGLQVHDVGGVMDDLKGGERQRPEGHPYLRLTRMLEPGVVVTIEPGIYFIDSLLAAAHADERRGHIDWSVVEALRPFGGIRIEDNVVTTAAAPENMTREAFAKLAA